MPDAPNLYPKPERKLDTEQKNNQITNKPDKKSHPQKIIESPSGTQTPQKPSAKKQPLHIQSGAVAKDVPLMFQAQIPDRGNIQYVGKEKEEPAYERWVKQWLEGCPPQPKKVGKAIGKPKLFQPIGSDAAPTQPTLPPATVQFTLKLPKFGSHVEIWEYEIRWRMVTNGGQDEGIIRPVMGAKGMPFFPGSSMKGAFRRACQDQTKCQRYCGGEVTVKGEKRTKPGILRFHGGYPVDMSWAQCDRLVDIAHGQQPYQVGMKDTKEKGENANVQISLYQPKFKFGISCIETLTPKEWQEIQKIWEKALGSGIGSRVSAGYGYANRVNQDGSVEPLENSDRILLSIHLNGQGLSSQLLLKEHEQDKHKTPEFRPNMFKAVLRGHTLRLLGGITDEQTAQILTKKLWGGIPEKSEDSKTEATVGCIGINFTTVEGKLCTKGKHTYQQYNNKLNKLVTVEMPIYQLQNGRLNLLKIGKVNPQLEKFIISLVKFSVLLGGFGKSWRRIHHKLFYPSYFDNKNKPMIGCDWKFAQGSEQYYIPVTNLSDITKFITNIREQAIAWVRSEVKNYQPNSYVENWREAWHPNKVQVWGRIANNKQSLAVQWFHETDRLKGSSLAGEMGQIGRIWHRMYPRYIIKDGKLICLENEFMEILTIFPNDLHDDQSKQFMEFLATGNSGFKQIEPTWGNEPKL
ncbi:hypothetical protein [Argonema antarcticum]|uniref:hypothetical protein n=1 Tax=Argonema antarcticum TaxID=2942763 RepID=UPI0020139EFE|nr:hypothetical protein [Argonema antarcticum]MCL1475014.1 hypothetical protein [Argonema antarcticum A004/B2]